MEAALQIWPLLRTHPHTVQPITHTHVLIWTHNEWMLGTIDRNHNCSVQNDRYSHPTVVFFLSSQTQTQTQSHIVSYYTMILMSRVLPEVQWTTDSLTNTRTHTVVIVLYYNSLQWPTRGGTKTHSLKTSFISYLQKKKYFKCDIFPQCKS